MPDRQQNINIKFNTNNVDIEKAAQLLNKAKAANDALNQSIQKTGTEGAQRVKQFSGTIEGLRVQMQQLKAQIDLTNQSDKSRLETLRGQYAAMSTQLKQYQGDLAKTTAGQKSLVDGLGGLYTAVRLALTAGLIRETISASLEMAKLKGTVEGVTRAFNTLPNATLLMADLKAKTHGTLDELTLMQKAVQAKNFKIPLEQLGTLLEFAAIKAQQTGLDINYLVNSLITGLGRNSIRLLDNLQISVTELREKTKELGSTQAAVFYLVNKQMQAMGGYIETDATLVDKLAASWTNFKIIVSDSNFWGFVVRQLNNAVEGAILLFSSAEANQKRFALQFATDKARQFEAGRPGFGATQSQIDLEKQLVTIRKVEINNLENEVKLTRNNPDLSLSSRQAKQKLLEAEIETMKTRNLVSSEYIKILIEYADSLNKVTPNEEEQLGLIEGWNKRIKEINDEIEKSTDVSGKQQKALTNERTELERLIKVYSEFDDGMKHAELTSRSLREEINKQIEAIQERLAKTLKPLSKGAVPAGGFQGPLGPADASKEGVNSPKARLDAWYDQYATFWDKLKMGFDDLGTHIRKGGEQTVEDQRRMWAKVAREVTDGLSTIFKDQLESFNSQEVASLDVRLKNTQSFYESQITLAGDNQNRVSLLRRKEEQEITRLQRDRDKAALRQARGSILINTAAAIVKALVEAPWPYNLVLAAVYGGMGASQLAILNRAPRGYAKGVIDIKGPGTTTSDSIPTNLSKGESVITAAATRDSMGLLKAIQARRINDRMIDEIIAKTGGSQGSNLDAKGIIAAIKSQPKPPDYFRVSENIFEAKKINDTTRRYVRRGFLG